MKKSNNTYINAHTNTIIKATTYKLTKEKKDVEWKWIVLSKNQGLLLGLNLNFYRRGNQASLSQTWGK